MRALHVDGTGLVGHRDEQVEFVSGGGTAPRTTGVSSGLPDASWQITGSLTVAAVEHLADQLLECGLMRASQW